MNVQTAPWLLFLKAHEAGQTPPEPQAFNIKKPMSPESIAAFINEMMDAPVAPIANQSKAMSKQNILVVGGLLAAGAAGLAAVGQLGNVVYNPWLAMTATMIFVLAMNSGYMFCKVRSISLTLASHVRLASTIIPNIQSQSGSEMWIIGGLNLINASAIIILGSVVPKIQHPVGKRIATLIFTAVFIYGFSTEIKVFQKKMPGYPFKLM